MPTFLHPQAVQRLTCSSALPRCLRWAPGVAASRCLSRWPLPTPTARRGLHAQSWTAMRASFVSPTTTLTSEKYPQFQRHPDYATLTPKDLQYFAEVLPPECILCSDPQLRPDGEMDDLAGFNTDFMGKYRGQSSVVLKPKHVQQISQILRYCNSRRLAVVPQGGNTGLVGGSVPVFDEVVINMANMSKIRSFDELSGVLVCDAGCVLEALDNHVAEKGHMMPLDLGAKGSCQIGGNVSTNAGGIRFLRYGSLHGSVLGLEIVLPDGTVVDNLSTLRKDSTGYDLKQLFIGAEGTLGIVTGVSIVTPPRPRAQQVVLFGVNSYEDVQMTFRLAKQNLNEVLSAYEFWDDPSMRMVLNHSADNVRHPLSDSYPFYVLVETSGFNKEHDDEKMSHFIELVMDKGYVADGVLSENETQLATFWAIRETISEATVKTGPTYKYDVSIPIPQLYNLVLATRQRLSNAGLFKDGDHGLPVKEITGYGHIGDGNLHLNVVAQEYTPEVSKHIEPFVYEWVASHQGSISAEHGLGLMKAPHLHYSKPGPMISMMKRIKHL
ncbi:D-lactate ferricytochrome c oxidoreductase, partial [Dimargaris xerosporica]